MRIFKNRGDIYISKINKKKSAETRFLIIALAVIVTLTLIFLLIFGIKNDFSVKKFFEPEDLKPIQTDAYEDEEPLPQISGKTNYIIIISKNDTLLFTELVQVDFDNTAYKVGTLKADTVIDGVPLSKTFKNSGTENVKNAVETYLGLTFDYYIQMENDAFSELFDAMGDFSYPIASEIKYKENESDISYSLKVKAGEQNIKGMQLVNMVRYYLDHENNTSAANDLLLNSLIRQMNQTNLQKSEKLFSQFSTNAQSNISVREFSISGDKFSLLCDERTAANAYSAIVRYDENNTIEKDSLQKFKGYFVK